jgi:hypothetical protein
MKKIAFVITTCLFLFSACAPVQPATPAGPGVETIVASTFQALTAVAPTATAELILPVPTETEAVSVATNNEFAFSSFGVQVRFFYPPELKEGLATETVAAHSLGAPWEIDYPEHVVVYFSAYGDPSYRSSNSDGIRVFRVEDLNAYDPELIPAIQAHLNGTTDEHRDFPQLPFPGRGVDAQVKTISFQNGMGYRFLANGSFIAAAPRSTSLIYMFVGLTSDGKYLVSVVTNVNAPFIADLATGVMFTTQEEATANTTAINDRLNAASPEDFSPSLAILDALVQSIIVVVP